MLGRPNPARSFFAAAWLAAQLCLVGCGPVFTGDTGPESTITYGAPRAPGDRFGPSTQSIDLPNVEFREALSQIANLYQIQIRVPAGIGGRTSLRLRDVTWRQTLDVLLTPVGYAYIVENGMVVVVSIEAYVRLPKVELSFECLFVDPSAMAEEFMQNVVSPRLKESVSVEGTIVRVAAHPGHVDRFSERFEQRDRPSAANPFRPVLEWPAEVPPEVLNRDNPDAPWERLTDPDERTTNILLMDYIDVVTMGERVRAMLDSKSDRIQVDRRCQGLIVTSDAARLQKIGRAVKYLDDPSWFWCTARAQLAETPFTITRDGFERIDHFCLFSPAERVALAIRDVLDAGAGEEIIVSEQMIHIFVRSDHRADIDERLKYASGPRSLRYFPPCPGLPNVFPEDITTALKTPAPESEEIHKDPGVYLFHWIDADLAAECLRPFLAASQERLDVDHLDNQLLFTATEARCRAFRNACEHLDNRRWYRRATITAER